MTTTDLLYYVVLFLDHGSALLIGLVGLVLALAVSSTRSRGLVITAMLLLVLTALLNGAVYGVDMLWGRSFYFSPDWGRLWGVVRLAGYTATTLLGVASWVLVLVALFRRPRAPGGSASARPAPPPREHGAPAP
ncbi:MAG TPA: hypothetical protein VKZ89_03175 [Thermobifida alba]|nr:hypothetical protein [Thermobifida alba]